MVYREFSEEFIRSLQEQKELLVDYSFRVAVYDQTYAEDPFVTKSRFSFIPTEGRKAAAIQAPKILDIEFLGGDLVLKSDRNGTMNLIDLKTSEIELTYQSSVSYKMDSEYVSGRMDVVPTMGTRSKIILKGGFAVSNQPFEYFRMKRLYGKLLVYQRYHLVRNEIPAFLMEKAYLELEIPQLVLPFCGQEFKDEKNFIIKGIDLTSAVME